jgi:hypothetical protein
MMIRITYLSFIFSFLMIVSSCKKEAPVNDTGSGPLNYASLTATDTLIAINGQTTLTANATGSGLTYRWWYESYGTILGSGKSVIYSVCHAGKFLVYCEVTDATGNNQTRSIYINAK